MKKRKSSINEGDAWTYYNKNGLLIGATCKQVKEYGKWYEIQIVFSNYSMFLIDFDPDDFSATLIDNKSKEQEVRVFSANDYMQKVKRRQNWTLALASFTEGVAAASAGYSQSTTTTNYNHHTSTYGSASARGKGGHASADFYADSYVSGCATSKTTTYNGAAAYQAQVIANDRIANYQSALLSERQAKDEGYLELTTVKPGETITGYVNIEQKKGKRCLSPSNCTTPHTYSCGMWRNKVLSEE